MVIEVTVGLVVFCPRHFTPCEPTTEHFKANEWDDETYSPKLYRESWTRWSCLFCSWGTAAGFDIKSKSERGSKFVRPHVSFNLPEMA